MKRLFILLFVSIQLFGQIDYDRYFLDKTLRIDYQHVGDATRDGFYFTEMIEEPYWGGPVKQLIEPFEYGKFRFEITDSTTGTLIYARNYSTLFSEWQTTAEAKKYGKSFSESVIIPYPRQKFSLTFYSRDKSNQLHKKTSMMLDPNSYFVKKDRRSVYPNFKVNYSGDPHSKVDIVIIPEGYTADELGKFKKDCQKFAAYLFKASPFKEHKDDFNIWGVEAPSAESGPDIPGKNVWKHTILNSGFYTFNSERYCMTPDYASVRDVAANAPYDQIYILVNTNKYGGGSIYNYYSLCVSDNIFEEYIFTHEFGHGFASLADEYVEEGSSYEDFYPLNTEPTDPNITTMVDFDKKWKKMLDKDTPIPTLPDSSKRSLVGVYEGAGYVAKGVYRPRQDCTMRSISVDNFCPVCCDAIIKMIDFYTK